MCKDCLTHAQRDFPDLPDNATALDIARKVRPDFPDDYLDYALWNETAYPMNHYHDIGRSKGWGTQLKRLKPRSTTPT